MGGKIFLDPTDLNVAYKLIITGDPELVGDTSATWFVTGTSPPFDALIEAVVDAIRGITDVSDLDCYRLQPGADGTLCFEP